MNQKEKDRRERATENKLIKTNYKQAFHRKRNPSA